MNQRSAALTRLYHHLSKESDVENSKGRSKSSSGRFIFLQVSGDDDHDKPNSTQLNSVK